MVLMVLRSSEEAPTPQPKRAARRKMVKVIEIRLIVFMVVSSEKVRVILELLR